MLIELARELLAEIRARTYLDATHTAFAVECAKHGVSCRAYAQLERKWLKRLGAVRRESIPRGVLYASGAYLVEVLAREDPRALWAGAHTNCCQHPNGEAASSAWHGTADPDGAVLAVIHRGRIVAQSWLWRSGDTVVADNCEALGGHEAVLPRLYQAAADALFGRLGIDEVRLGTSGDVATSAWNHAAKVLPAPEGCYSDAATQVLIARAAANH
jgi:hypothetical protein